MRKRFCGNILTAEMRIAFPSALRYTSPLQKPMAKLLNHSMAGGRGLRNLVAMDGAMININMRLDMSAEKNVLTNPAEESEKLASNTEDRYSLFSYDRLLLKKSPENKPVIKINMNISPSFFISMSPFSSIKDMRDENTL